MKLIKLKSVIFYLSYLIVIRLFWIFIETQYSEDQKIYICLLSLFILLVPLILWYNKIKINFKELIAILVLCMLFIAINLYIEREIDFKSQSPTTKSLGYGE